MRVSSVWFVVAVTILGLHQVLFGFYGGYETIKHNPMTGSAALLCYALAALAGFVGWRLRKAGV
jgi:hypothetical protein